MGNNGQGINVDLSKLQDLLCKCGENKFGKIHTVKKVPRVLSPTGTAVIVFIEIGIVCTACGEYYSMTEVNKTLENSENMIVNPGIIGG